MRKLSFIKLMHKKLLILLCFGLLYPAYLFGQDETTSKDFRFGGHIGTTISKFTNEQPYATIKQGIMAGAYANYYFKRNMSVQLELNYFQQGGDFVNIEIPYFLSEDKPYTAKISNNSITINTLDIPLFFKYSFPIGCTTLSGLIGPSFGYNFSTGVNTEATIFTESGSFHTYTGESAISEKIEKLNYAGTIGLCLEVPVSNIVLLVDGRYRYGFNTIYKSYSYINLPQITGDLSCNSWYITLGIAF